jgi:hypothetical protein
MPENSEIETSEKTSENTPSGDIEVFANRELAELDRRGREAVETENAPAWRPDDTAMGHPNPLVGQINDISLSVGTCRDSRHRSCSR